MQSNFNCTPATLRALVASTLIISAPAKAYILYSQGSTTINADLEAVFGQMYSGESYDTFGGGRAGSATWREGYIKYGFSGSQGLGANGSVYGKFNILSSATWGDGDAAGYTNGTERRTAVEDAYLGWRSGELFTAFGQDGVNISAGRQNIAVGDGFLVQGDAMNLGDVDLPEDFNRGGAYYLGARKAFDRTVVLRLGGEKGWRSDLMWLKSDNRAQAETEMAVVTLENITEFSTLGLTYIRGLDVNTRFANPAQLERDSMDTASLRASTSMGVKNLNLSTEYATQDKNSGRANAWYLEGSWSFAELPWRPKVTYRYSRFSETYDPLFYGVGRGYGTWFQGEVAGNYAGPFNNNTRVQHLGLKLFPHENVTLGVLYFDFDPLDRSLGDLGGRELDMYAEWNVNEHLLVSPVIGFYKPDHSANDGGMQLSNNRTNPYVQLVVGTFF